METYKIYNFYYIPTLREDFIAKTLIGKFIMIYKYSKEYLFFCYYEKKFLDLQNIYEQSYHPFFMFDLYKFLLNRYKYGVYPL